MRFEQVLLTDTAGRKSSTLTVFVMGAIIVNVKLVLSELVIYGIQFPSFGGTDYALALGALGGVYVLRRQTITEPTKEKEA